MPEKEKQDITPNKKLIKDPKVTNVGINDAFVFVTVQVPVADVITANQDGSRNPKALTELYSWTVNSGWTRMGNAADIKNESNVVVAHEYKYVYGTEFVSYTHLDVYKRQCRFCFCAEAAGGCQHAR